MLAALDPLAVEVVAAGTRLEREAQHIDEQLATLLRIGRDHRNAGNELNIHARSVWPVPEPPSSGAGAPPADKSGLPLVPALEEGASKCAVEQVEHQQGGRGFLVDLDPLGVEREDREDVAVPPVTLRRPGADVARHPGVVFELKGARREP